MLVKGVYGSNLCVYFYGYFPSVPMYLKTVNTSCCSNFVTTSSIILLRMTLDNVIVRAWML